MSLTTLLLLGAFGLGALLFLGLIFLVVMMTGKKAAPPQPQAVPPASPPPPPPPTPEDLLHAAFNGVKDYASRKSAIDIGQRLANYEADQMATAIAEGVQRRPTDPKG